MLSAFLNPNERTVYLESEANYGNKRNEDLLEKEVRNYDKLRIN